ncbi:MAG: hypothetical protein KJ619_03260 [Candidatus Omnitrophica bacterium]|nr:hypothetical protein [Candidatus Omnitrophota bacterium]MBU2250852.1 hypothetical protein [Candidatus Omnitrophota bacterium]MBU2473455.1 hypothetical protein [Candidatus Omnitrophota bacterium]
MKKLTILVSQKDLGHAIWELRKTGLLHIKPIQKPHADFITSLEHKLALLEKALSFLSDSEKPRRAVPDEVLTSVIKDVLTLKQKEQEFLESSKIIEERLAWVKQLGHISCADLESLESAGLRVKLYKCRKKDLKKIPPDKIIRVIAEKGREIYLVSIGKAGEEGLNFPEVAIPHETLQALERKIHHNQKELAAIKSQLEELSIYKQDLKAYQKELNKRLEFGRVRFSTGLKEEIAYLEGFCPKDSVEKINQSASREGWAVLVEEPQNSGEVPTWIKNPRWVEIIRPVFKFMGTLPGYAEHDISFWFLLFFSLFFAMLIGDAGYGLLFLTTTFLIRRKFKKLPAQPFFLMYILSAGTIIWGALSGTWFGVEKLAQLPVFRSLVIGKINSFSGTNQNFMIQLCFIIGAVHLSIAHAIMVYRFINSRIALSHLGWIGIVWSAFFLAGNLVLGKPLSGFTYFLAIVSAALVILFSSPEKNIIKGIFQSLADFPLKAIGSFSDVVSYLRLFAVGYATVVLAVTFNSMAASSGSGSLLGGFLAAIILFIGHALNIVLGLMAVIVHGIRLNMLEFSSHLNMEWSGIEYKPFKE